jgi:hypothetical protein
MSTELNKAYESGVLVPSVHSRLVQNMEQFARKANISESHVLYKMSQFSCTKPEIEYVKSIKRQEAEGNYGLVYLGKETKPVLTRMMAVAGACLRNFVDAKVSTIQEVFLDLKNGTPPDEVTVLLIPNFFMNRADGGKVAEWHIADLLGLLYTRMAKGKQTFVYVSDLTALAKAYGEPMATHLSNNFTAIDA